MDEFERVVRTHSEVRRLSDAQLRDQVNVAFAARDHKRSLALYWEGWRRQDQGTRDREAPLSRHQPRNEILFPAGRVRFR